MKKCFFQYISGLIPNLIKKSWTVSILYVSMYIISMSSFFILFDRERILQSKAVLFVKTRGSLHQDNILKLINYVYPSQLLVNITARSPRLVARGLPPGQVLFLRVYASNSKGRSRSVRIDGYTLRMADKRPGKKTFFTFH